MASGTKPHTTSEQIDPSWENLGQTSTSLTSYLKNPDLLKLKSTQPANQKTPKARFGTTNLSRILLAHQTLRPYLYPQRPLPQIAPYDQQRFYQSTTWPLKPRPQLLPPLEEEDPVPRHPYHLPQHPPQQQTLSNKSKPPSMLPSVALEEEEAQEEPLLEEEDRVHLDPQAVEELRQTLQYLLRKYQSQWQQMSAPWGQPHAPSQESAMKQKTGSTNYEDTIVLTLESQGSSHQFVKWPWHSHSWMDQRSPNGPEP